MEKLLSPLVTVQKKIRERKKRDVTKGREHSDHACLIQLFPRSCHIYFCKSPMKHRKPSYLTFSSFSMRLFFPPFFCFLFSLDLEDVGTVLEQSLEQGGTGNKDPHGRGGLPKNIGGKKGPSEATAVGGTDRDEKRGNGTSSQTQERRLPNTRYGTMSS